MEPKEGNRLLTAKLVGSYLRHHKVGASQVPDLIATVHRSLGELGQQPPAEEALTPAVSLRQSVRPNYVVCLGIEEEARTASVPVLRAGDPIGWHRRIGSERAAWPKARSFIEADGLPRMDAGFGPSSRLREREGPAKRQGEGQLRRLCFEPGIGELVAEVLEGLAAQRGVAH
jgi:ROS/MUCR transcriptional regulator protein